MKNTIFLMISMIFLLSCSGGNVYQLETLNGDLVVKGSSNGLMWYMDDPDNINTQLNQINYGQAVEFCENLTHAGYSDWRVPTIDELRTLVEGYSDLESGGRCKVSSKCLQIACVIKGQKDANDLPCSNPDTENKTGPGPSGCFFSDVWRTYCGPYWSSSKVKGAIDMVFQLDFADPAIFAVNYDYVGSFGFTRCVRK